jgi:hypothetical protein
MQKRKKYITPDLDRIQKYGRNWLQYTNRMPRNRLPRIKNKCIPTGRRNQEDHKRDMVTCETGTGQQVAQLHDS